MVEAGGVDKEAFAEAMTIALREFLDNLKEPPDIDALLKFYSFVLGESDWAIPVLCFSYIENEMEALMRRAMLHHEYNDRLFTGFGPLASADAKMVSLTPLDGSTRSCAATFGS